MMEDRQIYQEYYEGAYERLIEKNVPFYALDISGLKWTEIDTKEDFITAEKIFNNKKLKQIDNANEVLIPDTPQLSEHMVPLSFCTRQSRHPSTSFPKLCTNKTKSANPTIPF